MKIRTICILIKILKDYHELLLATNVAVNPEWRTFFTKQEFLSISTNGKIDPGCFIGYMPKYTELMSLVGREERIIGYMLTKLETGIQSGVAQFDLMLLRDLVTQLGSETHYLIEKKPVEYDEYDIANLKALLRKAGWVYPVWGIVDSKVQVQDVPQIKPLSAIFYDTKAEAEEILHFLVEEGYVKKRDVKGIESEFILNPKGM